VELPDSVQVEVTGNAARQGRGGGGGGGDDGIQYAFPI